MTTIILAAGASTRLGQPKQLLRLGEKTLLTHTIEVALSVAHRPVVVVLGAHYEAIKPTIEHLPIEISSNENWQQGMGSSIACGMAHVPPGTDAVLLLLCDQPYLNADVLNRLVEKWQSTGQPIVAAAYSDTVGVPALFDRRCFQELSALKGSQGAKPLLVAQSALVTTIPFPEGAVDVDTPGDWERVRKL